MGSRWIPSGNSEGNNGFERSTARDRKQRLSVESGDQQPARMVRSPSYKATSQTLISPLPREPPAIPRRLPSGLKARPGPPPAPRERAADLQGVEGVWRWWTVSAGGSGVSPDLLSCRGNRPLVHFHQRAYARLLPWRVFRRLRIRSDLCQSVVRNAPCPPPSSRARPPV